MHALRFLLGIVIVLLAYYPVDWFVAWLRNISGVTDWWNKTGVPVFVTGTFERGLAFTVSFLALPDAGTILAAWMVAKLAAGWQRVEGDAQQVQGGTLIALMAGIVSLAFGWFAGWLAR
jgi:hypothetical protein